MYIQQSTSNHTKQHLNIQLYNYNHSQTYCELFNQTIKRCHTRNTQSIKGYNITLTPTQVQETIKQS